jgi:hypothetical protein
MKHIFFFFCLISFSYQASSQFSITDFTFITGANTNSGIAEQVGGFDANVGILGGEIDYTVTSTNGTSFMAITATEFYMGFQSEGEIEIVWDGVDGDAFNIDHSSPIVDLGTCGDVSVGFNKVQFLTVPLDFDLTIEFYNSATDYITWTGPVSLLSGPQTVDVNTSLFQTVGATFDFNNVTAIRIVLGTTDGSNVPGLIESFSWVPNLSPTTPCDPIPAAPIPTLSQWGLIALLLLSLIFGTLAIARRRSHSVM